MVDDLVNHPPHYTSHKSGVECITITEHMGFLLGSAMKYIWRCDLKKDAIEDLKKARWYLDREIANREKAATAPSSVTVGGEKYTELAVDEALRYLKVDEQQKRAIPRFYMTDEERAEVKAEKDKEMLLGSTSVSRPERTMLPVDQSDDQAELFPSAKAAS